MNKIVWWGLGKGGALAGVGHSLVNHVNSNYKIFILKTKLF